MTDLPSPSERPAGVATDGLQAGGLEETRAAYLDFYDREYLAVIKFLRNYGANMHDAQDATQEAFLEAWELTRRPGYWASIQNPRGWIRKVALNLLRRPPGLRRKPLAQPVSEIPETPHPGLDHGELIAQHLAVLAALHSLDQECRSVMAFHLDGFSAVAIAAQLNMTDQQVRDRVKKGRKALKRRLAEHRELEERDNR
ncbi:RNA polymerase sigma factor [Streptosporangium lutulentum]|uniref:RNA polymerase sigma-70 factor (ECF subfamily) n=1 Tax=Streptosporangium lutulentum TaxID=1461250 RepID=A0ABT9QU24_9ACTN|nr:sigma-70 family RNA polymerase sigma factor [Streptosporangium lutulentum]MDP9850277.1 RNA polymerase sigma-70 factor (ECF subfamily) [Streptosporangium lutulentum]